MARIQPKDAHTYKLTVSNQTNQHLTDLAMQQNTDIGEIVRRAVNLYAALNKYRESGVYVRERSADTGQLVVKRLMVP
jgi:hypothetical protein